MAIALLLAFSSFADTAKRARRALRIIFGRSSEFQKKEFLATSWKEPNVVSSYPDAEWRRQETKPLPYLATYQKGTLVTQLAAPTSRVRIEGGSYGFQIGGASTDVLMLIMNEKGMNRLLSDKFTIGGEAAAAAGPVGRNASANTDVLLRLKSCPGPDRGGR